MKIFGYENEECTEGEKILKNLTFVLKKSMISIDNDQFHRCLLFKFVKERNYVGIYEMDLYGSGKGTTDKRFQNSKALLNLLVANCTL